MSENFRTQLTNEASINKIDYKSKLLFIGSCFSENMGQKLKENKFPILINPFGILYNPLSISQNLEKLTGKNLYSKDDLFFHRGLWHSFDHHGIFSSPDVKESISEINNSLVKARDYLKEADFLFITLGTSYVYKIKTSMKIAANCHKLPASHFERYRLKQKDIVSTFNASLNKIKTLNSNLKIIFTLSPIRHIKDGLHNNQISKSILLLAIDNLVQQRQDCSYFPSYEIVMDDLRDYRFYTDDLLHLNSMALNYIWNYFKESYFEKETKLIQQKIQKLVQGKNHRVLHAETEENRIFQKSLQNKIEYFSREYPFIKF